MAKGHQGETLKESIKEVMMPGERVTFSELVSRIKSRGTWKDSAIWQHLMGLVVNLPPAKHHWPQFKEQFLFLHEDGHYELYDLRSHPKPTE